MGMRGVSRILPFAAPVLPAAGVRSPAQAVVGDAKITEYAPAPEAPDLADLRPELSAAASSSGGVTVCVSQNKDLATNEWCTKLCKANVTQSAEAQAAEPSECD